MKTPTNRATKNHKVDAAFHRAVLRQSLKYSDTGARPIFTSPEQFSKKAPALFELIYRAECYAHFGLSDRAKFPRLWRYRGQQYELQMTTFGRVLVYNLQGLKLVSGMAPMFGKTMPDRDDCAAALRAMLQRQADAITAKLSKKTDTPVSHLDLLEAVKAGLNLTASEIYYAGILKRPTRSSALNNDEFVADKTTMRATI